ncbi:hypothetical protein E2C01_041689 [Portunus trituberculatus]|uniref:Uncharacterized protein n=1 Tax=Portunus trituberculatus TaxID=210409 RepID=A0A5B7FSJ0_PORTR|nr:hypothetical protein [Portunus trituberculatus]
MKVSVTVGGAAHFPPGDYEGLAETSNNYRASFLSEGSVAECCDDGVVGIKCFKRARQRIQTTRRRGGSKRTWGRRHGCFTLGPSTRLPSKATGGEMTAQLIGSRGGPGQNRHHGTSAFPGSNKQFPGRERQEKRAKVRKATVLRLHRGDAAIRVFTVRLQTLRSVIRGVEGETGARGELEEAKGVLGGALNGSGNWVGGDRLQQDRHHKI